MIGPNRSIWYCNVACWCTKRHFQFYLCLLFSNSNQAFLTFHAVFFQGIAFFSNDIFLHIMCLGSEDVDT